MVTKITIVRESENSKSITGSIFINDKFVSYTLELPYKNNENNVSSIPAGEYGAFVRTDGKRGWRLELTDTEHRENIQLHKGNRPSEIKGCVLLGTEVDSKNNFVGHSDKAREKLKEAWELSQQCPSTSAVVEIKYKDGYAQCTEPKISTDQCTDKNKNQDKDKEKERKENEEKNKEKEKKDKEDKNKETEKKEKGEKKNNENKDKDKEKVDEKKSNASMPAPDNGSDPCPTNHPIQTFVIVIPTPEEMEEIIASLDQNKGECGTNQPTPTEAHVQGDPKDNQCGSTGRPQFPIIPKEFDPLAEPRGWCGTKDPIPPLPRSSSIPFFGGTLKNLETLNNKEVDNSQSEFGFSKSSR